jgi:hypothetical protein
MGNTASSLDDSFVQPTQVLLDDLGPGCFVQKLDSNGFSYWVEITSIGNSGYECIAHPSLITSADESIVSEGDLVTVKHEQITALGCDRFCFC